MPNPKHGSGLAAQEVDERETRKWKMCVSRADRPTQRQGGKHSHTRKGGRIGTFV